MQSVKLMQLLAAVLPLAHSAIAVVEQMFPSAGQGAKKLDAVVSLVESSLSTLGASVDQISALAPLLKGIISTFVGIMNVTGIFKKAGAPAPTEGVPGS